MIEAADCNEDRLPTEAASSSPQRLENSSDHWSDGELADLLCATAVTPPPTQQEDQEKLPEDKRVYWHAFEDAPPPTDQESWRGS